MRLMLLPRRTIGFYILVNRSTGLVQSSLRLEASLKVKKRML